jgi:hypothetical protein
LKREFLVVYDYGQGGIWEYIRAMSAEQIEALFPELKVVAARPARMTPEIEQGLRKRAVDVDEQQTGFLADILKGRPSTG